MKRTLLLISAFLITASFCAAQRLPKIAVPEGYKLTLTPDFSQNNFAGEETIQVQVLEPTSKIVLNSADITFQSASITADGVTQNATVTPDKANETVTLSVEKPLAAGSAAIQIKYGGILNNQLRGFYLGHEENGEKYAATQFESTDARRAFPSFDEPAYKATFDTTVIAPKDMVVLSNSEAVSDIPGPGADEHTVHFATTPKMSSYLVAVVVGHFESIAGSADGIPIRVWTTPGKKELGTFALDTAEHAMQYYNHYFAIKYPYGKLDLIGLPDFSAGAMENTACITFRDVDLLLNDKTASADTKEEIATVITHEMAHQWFGDLVTMQWWDDIWLNEGFATWMSSKPVEAWHPEWGVPLDDVRDAVGAMGVDSLLNTRPVHQAAETPAQIEELFDGIAYDKAAAVLRMLESYLGPETFRDGVNLYLKQHAYGNATSGDFWTAQTEASKKPVNKIMPTFIEQPGVPMVSVKSQCSGKTETVSLSQRRYFYEREKFEQGSPEVWMIPVCMKASGSSGEQQTCRLLTKKEETFTLDGCPSWVLTNAGAKGYYRSGYTPAETHAIARKVETSLSPAERIMLLSDSWASVRVGLDAIGDYLALADGFQADRNRAVMGQLIEQLNYIGENLVNNNDRQSYQDWVRRLLTPAANELGWQPRPNDTDDQKELRAALLYALGHTAQDPQAIAVARELTEKELQDPGSVPQELAASAFPVAAENGDAALYDQIKSQLKATKTPEAYALYMRALSRFTDPALVQKTLEFSLSPEVRSQDASLELARVMINPASQRPAWDFVQAHWSDIEKEGDMYGVERLVYVAGNFCDAGLRDQVKDFFSTHQVPSAERTLKQSLERVNYCVDLKSQQSSQLAAWLQHHATAAGE
jgi:puromycin-sensitive aminopeptidase